VKLELIAEKLGCALRGNGDTEITGVSGIDEAGPHDLTFVSNRKYAASAKKATAGAILVTEDFPELQTPTLRTSNPYLAFARSIELFYKAPRPAVAVDPTARVHASARIGKNASIGPYVVIDEDVVIGDDAILGPFTHIGIGVCIGAGFRSYSHVSVREFSEIGNNVILQDGVRVGTDGYGYAKREDGSYHKIVQSGIVVLEDDVEVGANSTIDRATVGETRIRRGAKIDNLVQVGHASVVGEDTLLCAQVGLGGSSKIGANVVLTGQVGVAGHLEIGDGVVATAQTGIPNSVEAGKLISGYPAIDNRLWLKCSAIFKRLPELLKRIDALERKQ
jgi:UDP-3-O-[3-hydroxymyristoyl] glucosamine N-acyltransferase